MAKTRSRGGCELCLKLTILKAMSLLGCLLASSWVTTYAPHKIVRQRHFPSVLVALEPDFELFLLLCFSPLNLGAQWPVTHLHRLENTPKTDPFTLQLGISLQSRVWIDPVWDPGGSPRLYFKQKHMSWFIGFHSLESAHPQSQQLNYLQPRTHWIWFILCCPQDSVVSFPPTFSYFIFKFFAMKTFTCSEAVR